METPLLEFHHSQVIAGKAFHNHLVSNQLVDFIYYGLDWIENPCSLREIKQYIFVDKISRQN